MEVPNARREAEVGQTATPNLVQDGTSPFSKPFRFIRKTAGGALKDIADQCLTC